MLEARTEWWRQCRERAEGSVEMMRTKSRGNDGRILKNISQNALYRSGIRRGPISGPPVHINVFLVGATNRNTH